MRIAIVTIHDTRNFGNRLQNYALFFFLKKQGYKSVSLVSSDYGRFEKTVVLHRIKEVVDWGLCKIPKLALKVFSPSIKRRNNFNNWSRRIPTKYYYNSFDLPEKIGDDYDFFFAGSDQIWNYSFSADQFFNFFLRFVKPEKRVAIAASFGVETIPEEWRNQYTDWLGDFAHISVRENAGANIIKELIGRDVPVLIDPAMMLTREEWLCTAKKPLVNIARPYVLKYFLGEDDQIIDKWAKENGYQVYDLMNKNNPELYSAGPGEFLTLIDNAALVYSDSFHCIALSIVFKKPFIVCARKGEYDNMTSRVDTLLEKFGFQNRWENRLTEKDYLNCDYSNIDDCISAEKKKFSDYVSMAISHTVE